MNLCLLIKDFAVGKKFAKNGLPTKSGAEFQAENHAKQLMAHGANVTIMAKKRYWFTKARENLNGIDLVRLHAPFRWLEILLRLITTHRHIDCFYILGTPAFAVWVILYAKFTHKPVTLTLTIKEEIFRPDAGWRNKIFSLCTNYIAISQEIRRGLVEQTNINPTKITVLPQGIDTKEFCAVTAQTKAALRQKHQIEVDCPILLFCARIDLRKGIDTLEKIWPKVHERFPQAKFLMVGGGRHEYVSMLQELSQKTNNSLILVGEVEKPQEYYQIADVYVFPSRAEGLPTTLMEAMSAGLPAVTSNIGGCEDLIISGKNGFLVEPEDDCGFAEKIMYLFANENERRSMGENARRFAEENCDYAKVVDKLAQILAQK